MDATFLKLRRRTEDNLITFLRIEVDLATTFRSMAATSSKQGRRVRLLGNIRKVVGALRQFEPRVTNRSLRSQLHKEADKLEAFVSSAER
jgi:hypothetical protein